MEGGREGGEEGEWGRGGEMWEIGKQDSVSLQFKSPGD